MNELNQWINDAASLLRADPLWRDGVSVSGPKHDGAGSVIDIDTERVIAQFVVWPTWGYEASALSVDRGEPVHFESKSEADRQTLSEGWDRFMAAVRAAEPG